MVFSLEQKAELILFDYNFLMIFFIEFCLEFYFVEKIYIFKKSIIGVWCSPEHHTKSKKVKE